MDSEDKDDKDNVEEDRDDNHDHLHGVVGPTQMIMKKTARVKMKRTMMMILTMNGVE